MAPLIQEQLRQIGIRVELDRFEFPVFLSDATPGDFDSTSRPRHRIPRRRGSLRAGPAPAGSTSGTLLRSGAWTPARRAMLSPAGRTAARPGSAVLRAASRQDAPGGLPRTPRPVYRGEPPFPERHHPAGSSWSPLALVASIRPPDCPRRPALLTVTRWLRPPDAAGRRHLRDRGAAALRPDAPRPGRPALAPRGTSAPHEPAEIARLRAPLSAGPADRAPAPRRSSAASVRGDLGMSIEYAARSRRCSPSGCPATLLLGGAGAPAQLHPRLWLGVRQAVRRGSREDRWLTAALARGVRDAVVLAGPGAGVAGRASDWRLLPAAGMRDPLLPRRSAAGLARAVDVLRAPGAAGPYAHPS